MQTTLKIGTRGSPLALAQAHETQARLMAAHGLPEAAFEVVVISTSGDRIQDRPLSEAGGKGLFTKEIEEALLAGRIDIAVHSSKDMPTLLPDGLELSAFLPREDARDAFVGKTAKRIADLPQGVVAITWQVVSPNLAGPIAYHFKEGSNQWWTAVQIRNHRNPIATFEYLAPGNQWVSVPRTSYNYFVLTTGMGPGPYSFRVTDSYGNVLTDSGIPHVENGTVNGASQFPPGP